jgi:hypothetical protein
VGLACQFQNKDDDKNANVAVDDLQPYFDDAPTSSSCQRTGDQQVGQGACRHGSPRTFNLKQIGVGNEQWGELYPVRLQKFIEQIRAKYPTSRLRQQRPVGRVKTSTMAGSRC